MYLGIDYGKKRIGLAVGSVFPRGAGVLDGEMSDEKVVEAIAQVFVENECEGIVMGMPTKRSGDDGEMAPKIRSLAEMIKKKTGLEVFFEEEELTSAEAERILQDSDKEYSRKSGKTDEMAAVLILEQFLADKIKL